MEVGARMGSQGVRLWPPRSKPEYKKSEEKQSLTEISRTRLVSPSLPSLHSSHCPSVFIQTTTSQRESLGGSIVLDNIKLKNVPIAVGEATGGIVLEGGTKRIVSWAQVSRPTAQP
jgi:hypothetical protein